MQWSDERNHLVEALVKVAGSIEDPTKDKKVDAGAKKYRYATLASFLGDCRRALAKENVILTQGVGETYTTGVITTLSHTSGQWVASFIPFAGEMRDAQAMGSALTYAKRYGILSILGLAPEDDDDGAAASKKGPSAMPPAPKGTDSNGFPDRAPPSGKSTTEALDLTLANQSKAKPRETDAEKQARQDAHDGKWEADRTNFMAALAKLEFKYDEVCEFQEWRKTQSPVDGEPPKGKPSTVGRDGRLRILNFLKSVEGADLYGVYLDSRGGA